MTFIEGIYSIRGTVNDTNLLRWDLRWKKAAAPMSDYKVLPGYSGTNRFPGVDQEIAAINTSSLGWRGNYNLALTAIDEAGNQNTTEMELYVSNDAQKPALSLNGAVSVPGQEGESLTSGDPLYRENTYNLTVTSSDNADEHDRGLRSMRLWIEEVGAGLSGWKRELASATFPRPNRLDETLDPAEDVQELSNINLDVSKLPMTSTATRFAVKAEAVDFAGNKETRTIGNLSLGNVLWKFHVWPPAFPAKGENPAEFRVLTTKDAEWEFEVYPVNVQTGQSDRNTLLRRFTSNGVKTQDGRAYWFGDDESGTAYSPGPYEVLARVRYATSNGNNRTEESVERINVIGNGTTTLAQGPRLREFRVDRDPLNDDEGDIYMAMPEQAASTGEVVTDFLIRQGAQEKVQIRGAVGDFAVNFLDGSEQDEMPRFDSGYGDAFWALEYKSAAARPFMSDILAKTNPYYSLTNRDNWYPIAWSTAMPEGICEGGDCDGSVAALLAEWDASGLPLGYYDIRLWVTDGRNMVHHVVGGMKVVPNSTGSDGSPNGGPGSVGALTLASTDMTIPFSGFTAEIARDYNSKDTYTDGPLGYGWKLRGINLKMETYDQGSGEADEAFITLPDGREFWFANVPPKGDNAGGFMPSSGNVWNKHGEYLQRPFGMRLYRPGGSRMFHREGDGVLFQWVSPGKLAPGADRDIPLRYNHPITNEAFPLGSVAYLQTEDKTWYVFRWGSGDLLEIIHPDGQANTFSYGNEGTEQDTSNPATFSAEIEVIDTAGRVLRLIRDSDTGRIQNAIDPNGHEVTYEYDDYGNLITVTDRRGFQRYYIYDTFETRLFFEENFPGEIDNLTGIYNHRLVDVRIDDDRDGVENFVDDIVPAGNLADMDIPEQTAALIQTQRWPGDTSIMKFEYCGDDICAYETGAGSVRLAYEYEEDGSGTVEVEQSESGKASRVEYNPEGRVDEVQDIYGAVTTYTYGTEEGENSSISGVLTEEVDALGNVTSYNYPTIPAKTPGSFSEIFEGFLNSKLSGECPSLYLDCHEDYIPQDAPGYLTGAQIQPNKIFQKGKSSEQGDWIPTEINYLFEDSQFSVDTGDLDPFQPDTVTDALGNITDMDYDTTSGSLSSISRQTPGGTEQTMSTTTYLQVNSSDPIFGTPHGPYSPYVGKTATVTSTLSGDTTEYGYRLNTVGITQPDSQGPAFFEEHVVKQPVPGETDKFSYSVTRLDAQGRVVESFTLDNAPAATSFSALSEKRNRSVTYFDPEGRVVRTEDSAGNKTYNDYDWTGRLVRTEFVPAPRKTEEEQGLNKTITLYEFDELGRQTVVETRRGTMDGEVLSRTETIRKTIPETPAEGQPITGRLEIVIDNRGGKSESRYDAGNRLMGTRRYDGKGRLLDETSYSYDALGRQEIVWNLNAGSTRTKYDDFGRVEKTIQNEDDPQNELTTVYHYDKGGRQVAQGQMLYGESQPASWTVNTYDNEGRVARVYLYQSSPDPESVSDNAYLDYAYDEEGRRYAERDVAGRWTYTHYDEAGRVASTILNWQPGPTWLAAEPEDRTPLAEANLPARITDVANRTDDTDLRFDFRYDDDGRQTHILKPGAWSVSDDGAVPAGYLELRKFYDGEGRLYREAEPVNYELTGVAQTGVPYEHRKITSYGYDEDGRIEVERYGIASADFRQTSFGSAQIRYDYNETNGRLREKKVYNDNGELDRREAYHYEEITGDLKHIYTYNKHNTLVREETTYREKETGLVTARVTAEGTISYQYDDYGRLEQIATSTGLQTRYKYDDYGRLETVVDPGLAPSGAGDSAVRYSYDARSRKTAVHYPNNASATYSYDDARGGWVSEIVHTGATGQLLRLAYARQDDGLIARIAEERPDGDQTWAYDYDGLKRLNEATRHGEFRPTGSFTTAANTSYVYRYDRRGNRVYAKKNASIVWSDYNPLDQLVATYQGSAGHNEDAPRPSGLTKLRENTWDQLGRHTAETVLGSAAESRSYAWSGDDRLLSVKLGSASDAPVVSYTYDSSGTRVARSALPSSPGDDPEETRYLADYENLTGYSQILAEVGASEEDSRSYVYGQEHLPLAQLGGGSGPAFFHGDHLGTTRQLTGPSGDALLASPANYSPFGDPENAALSSLTSMAYTGQHRDSATDLQYHRARWLSTEKGRWLSEDPVFDFPANFGNRYGYVGGGVIGSVDLNGLFTIGEVLGVLTISHLLVSVSIKSTIWGLRRAEQLGYDVGIWIDTLKTVDFWWDVIGFLLLAIDLGRLAAGLYKAWPSLNAFFTKWWVKNSLKAKRMNYNAMKGFVFEHIFKFAYGWTKNVEKFKMGTMRSKVIPDFIPGFEKISDIRQARQLVEVFWKTGKLYPSTAKYKQLANMIELASHTKGKTLLVLHGGKAELPRTLLDLAKVKGVTLLDMRPQFEYVLASLRGLFMVNAFGGAEEVIWDDDVED